MTAIAARDDRLWRARGRQFRFAERATDLTMPGFEDNRRLGLGHFLTRADLEKYDGMQLATVLQQMPGYGMVVGRGHEWPTSLFASTISGTMYVPTATEKLEGMRMACYAQVYIDGTLMNGGREPTEPFDIASISPDRVEAIEYYANAAQTPFLYSRMASGCGVLVIWTRR